MAASLRSIPSSAASGRAAAVSSSAACSGAGGGSSKRSDSSLAPEVLETLGRVERGQAQPVAREAQVLEQRLAVQGVRERRRAASRQDAEAGPGAPEEVEGDVHGAAVEALPRLGLDQVERWRLGGALAQQPLVEAQPLVAGGRNLSRKRLAVSRLPARIAPSAASQTCPT